ncbi:XdhC family protein [Paracoccus shanxieyensis]|uniref:XdhC family protein n=1 Tax=Paracoccus shanxieyensis TaxID=2675752 RepID=A0A6L6J0A1_9RHOB|nr:XdhC family protein [Paracoccus shanxieyensis]MTH64087.1 XdhC family protein [Paracoccus shanxieyensis]MTH86872.1 XdhC family protein [Paracoccus shanxieyensis]
MSPTPPIFWHGLRGWRDPPVRAVTGKGLTRPVRQDGFDGDPATLDPWRAALACDGDLVFAVLVATHGPAYRNPGATMVIDPQGRYAGAITSGCIESDIVLRAAQVRADGQSLHLRYGAGSPYMDLRLPCGGAIEVLLFRSRDRQTLRALQTAREARQPVALRIHRHGDLALSDWQPSAFGQTQIVLGFRPEISFAIFGTGAEATVFARLVNGMGYAHTLFSHDQRAVQAAQRHGSAAQLLSRPVDYRLAQADRDTAVVLMYHDHDYEPEIIRSALATPAFYIGAQGSRATQAARLARLSAQGVPDDQLARIRGPIGLIPSSRDPKSLAISVLAEVLNVHSSQSTPLPHPTTSLPPATLPRA